MAPDKFEKNIREKIKERRIAPSEEAWNRIAELIPAEERKRSRPFLRYSLAASFAALMIISLYLIQSRDEAVTPPVQVVETEQQRNEEPQVIPGTTEDKVATNITTAVEGAADQEQLPEPGPSLAEVAPETVPVGQDVTEAAEEVIIAAVEQQENRFIQSKISEVVAEVRLLEANNEALTEAEVDSLLRKAQSEILNERLFAADNTVDAMALLNEVEEELDQSFRDQLFERLKSGFMKVRTAVADRNN